MARWLAIIVLVLAGCFLIIFNDDVFTFIEDQFNPKDNRPTVAVLKDSNGEVRYKLPKSLRFRSAPRGLKLKDQDTIVTNERGTAIIEFNSGFEVEVLPNSIVVIEEPTTGADGTIRVTFLRGEFNVIKAGAAGKVIIKKEEKLQDAAGAKPLPPLEIKMAAPEEKVEETIKPIEVEEIAPPIKPKKAKVVEAPKPKKKREGLPDAYIASVIKDQRPFFQHCYERFRRISPDGRGRIQFAFTIEPSGEVSSVNVLGATISDPTLQSCASQVFQRLKFRAFDGDPMVVNYPINFE